MVTTLQQATALAQQGEPRAWINSVDDIELNHRKWMDPEEWVPLYTAAPAPQAQECTRSHPHELMDGCCELRTELARLTNENAILKAASQPAQGEWINDEGRLKWAMCRIAELESALQSAQPAQPLKHNHQWIRTGAMEPGQVRCIECGEWGSTLPVAQPVAPVLTGEQFAEYFAPRQFQCECGKCYSLPPKTPAQPVAQPLTIEAIKSMDCRITFDEHIRVVRMTEAAHDIT